MSQKQKILLVDDHLINIEILNELFQDDYEVFFATNGKDAITLAQTQLPDIILLDIMMPGMSGQQVCEHLKSTKKTRDIPIIFVTAMTSNVDEEIGLAMGAVDYVTKPINATTVKLRVKNQLELKLHRDKLEELVALRTVELETARDAAETGNRAKHEFLMVVSHELRAPLSSIIGFSDFMVSSAKDASEREMPQHILNAGNTMLELVNDILDLTSVEPETEYEKSSLLFCLPELLNDVQQFIIGKAAEKQLAFALEMDPALPKTVQGDRKRLLQVLRHLLKNAVKFTSTGSIQLEVLPSPDKNHVDTILFRITDSGIGIDPEKQDIIFQHFTQIEKAKTRSKGGLGLGLTICKRFVKLLGGKIWVESVLDKGSVFSFTAILPEAKA